MNVRYIGFIGAAIASLGPAISIASPEKEALNACAHAFASSLSSPGAVAPQYKILFGGSGISPSVSDFYARTYTFDLRANDPKTGMGIARASCSTDRHGGVVAFSPVPM